MTREVYKHGRVLARSVTTVGKIYSNAKPQQQASFQSQTATPRRRHRPNARHANVPLQPPVPGAHVDVQLRHRTEPPGQSVRLIGYYPTSTVPPPTRESMDIVVRMACRIEQEALQVFDVCSAVIYASVTGVYASDVPDVATVSDNSSDAGDEENSLVVAVSTVAVSDSQPPDFSSSADYLAEKILFDLAPSAVLAMVEMSKQSRDTTSCLFSDTANIYANTSRGERSAVPTSNSDYSEASESRLFEDESDVVGEHLHDILMSHSDSSSSEWEEYEVVEHDDDCDCDDWEQI
ncbi:hypothetical protein HDU83_001882 [Entophlyctis luteolus]|nr:hypothetical protein HDU83_001882 [Entophlyctis luteolus]